MNAVEALDDYLLGLLAEAVPAAPAAAAPAALDATAGVAADDVALDACEGVAADDVALDASAGAPAEAVALDACEGVAAGAASAATEQRPEVAAEAAPAVDANLAAMLAEMDADPAFAPAKPAPAAAPTLDIDANTAAMLAEMDADPAFAPAKPAPAAAPTLDIDANTAAMLAEMDADPAFAPAKPAPAAAPTLDIDANTAAMLAEMDADPAFVPAKPAPPKPAMPAMTRPRPSAPIAPIARRPAAPRASRLPPNIAAMFQPPPSDPSPHRRAAERSTRWLRLRCGEQTYALELLKVQEVVLPVPLLPLRGAARSMLGIMNLRGQVVPVLDLGLHLGAAPVVQDPQTRVVVLEENGETMGLRVSAVEDVASLTDQQIEPPDTTRLCRISNHLFRGVARISAHPVILLDATQLLH